MNQLLSKGKNIGFQVFFKFCAIGLGIYTSRWLNTNLSVDQYADYNLIVSYNSIVLAVVTLGIPTLIHKIFTNEKNKELVGKAWKTFLYARWLSYIIGLIFVLCTFTISGVSNVIYVIGIFTVQFILIADLSYKAVSDSVGSNWQFTLTDLCTRALLVISLLLSSQFLNYDLIDVFNLYIVLSIFSNFTGYILDHLIQRKYIPKGKLSPDIIQMYLPSLFFMSLTTIITSFYFTTDKLFLNFFEFGDIVINSYSNAFKLFELTAVVPGLIMPVIASQVKKRIDALDKKKEVLQTIGITVVGSFMFGIALTCFILIASPIVIRVIDPGLRYSDAIPLLRYLSFGLLFLPIIWIASPLNNFLHGEKYELGGAFALSIVSILLYILLIPALGGIGAAITTIITLSVDSCIKLVTLYKLTNTYLYEKQAHQN